MKQYLAFFKIKFITGLQYRASALAGISTQFFFGFVFIFIYMAFYSSNIDKAPMEFSQLVSYFWLGQAFFALTYVFYKEQDIIQMIRDGNVAYELCKPGNIYFKWFARIYASKTSKVLLRFMPIIVVSILLPKPYNLSFPPSIYNLFCFIILLFLSSFLITAFATLLHTILFYVIKAEGLLTAFKVIAELFSGGLVPILFLPEPLKIISSFLPFQYVSDVPYRIYSGNIDISNIFKIILIQLFWIIVIIFFGNILTKKILKKAIIQGG